MLPAILTIAAWIGLCCSVAGSLYLASLFLRGEFADDASSDQPHGDIPFIPEDLKRAGHLAPISDGAQQDHV